GCEGQVRVGQSLGRVPHSFAYCANEWALACGKTLDRTTLDFQRPLLKFHAHQSGLPVEIGAETAPPPLLRALHQSPFHRIPVDVTQLLDVLARAPHIEIVEALLPNRLPHPLP